MENTLTRLKQYIDSKGIKVSAFEKEVGFSNGAFASQLRNNKTIGVDKLENILKIYPEIDIKWLLTGLTSDITTKEDITNFNKNSLNRNKIQPSQKLELKESQIIYDDPSHNPGAIPFYESDAFAGPMAAFNDGVEIPSSYIYSPGFEDCTMACRASGDSMEDKVHAGDIIVCKQIHNKEILSYGDMYLIVTAEHRLLKVVRKGSERGWIILRSYNKEYDDIDIKLDDVLSLFLIKGVISKTQI
jgi:repressor LexA